MANLYNKNKFKARSGERYASALTKISHGNNIIQRYGKIDLKDYIRSFIESRNMKIKSSLKSIKKDLNSKLVEEGRVML